jgi:DNA-binding MarR family transcriptional regulator
MTIGSRGQSERLAPCVCNTLRMVARVATRPYDDVLRPSGLRVTQFSTLETIARRAEASVKQLEDALAVDQTTLTRGLSSSSAIGLSRARRIPTGVKAMRLTPKGRRTLDVARPLWVRAQDKVLRELGAKAWDDAQRRLTRVFHVVVSKRRHGSRRRRVSSMT